MDSVDISAQGEEVEFVSTGVGASLPAEVTSPGRARIPYPFFEIVFRDLKKLGSGRLTFHLDNGQIGVGSAVFKHAGISMQEIERRIADLPIDAPLVETLSLDFKFSSKELMDSGLLARVSQARQEAEGIIEQAAKVLEPLQIDRWALREFVWEKIREGFTTRK